MTYNILMNPEYIEEMNGIKKSLSSYPGYEPIASALGKFLPQNIVAGLIGCIVPESGTNHRILNAKEFKGNGASGTQGWNCGEGLIQWTYWKYKLPIIKKYNADPRSTQKLPEVESIYMQGSPIKQGNLLISPEDGKHISGLTLENQMLFLSIYYKSLTDTMMNEDNIATVTAKIYQMKAGNSYYKSISDPIERAYVTSKYKYPSTTGNHYLQSVKIAQEYVSKTISPDLYGVPYAPEYIDNSSMKYIPNNLANNDEFDVSNNVTNLAFANTMKKMNIQQNDKRKNEFNSLRTAMISKSPKMGRNIFITEELYDSNILKGNQESKKERT